jgi:hypothetical protein
MKRARPPTPPNARRQYNPGPDDREDVQPGELITRQLARPPIVRSTAPPRRGAYAPYGALRHARLPPNPHKPAYQPSWNPPVVGLVCLPIAQQVECLPQSLDTHTRFNSNIICQNKRVTPTRINGWPFQRLCSHGTISNREF